MRDEILIPSVRNMGFSHMNCIVNLKNIFFLLVYFFMQASFALMLRMVIVFTGKCIARYQGLSSRLFFA